MTVSDDLLNVTDAAKRLQVSQSTIWRWIRSGELPAHRVGPKRVRLRIADLDRIVTPLTRRREAVTTDLSNVARTLSDEDAARLDAAIEKSKSYKSRILHGYPTPSWILIREARIQRTAALMNDFM